MSYPPHGGYPQQQPYPPQGHSPYNQQPPYPPPMSNQQGYPPPQGQYPPQQPYGAPPPQGHYPPQQSYGSPPPQGHYPPQQPYGAPPPQGHYPPQQPYGAPPPQGGHPPPQHGYGAPPPQGYPPPQQGYPPQGQQGYPPPQGQYPPPQNYAGPPAPPSLGYDLSHVSQVLARPEVSRDVEALRNSMKGFGTNEGKMIEAIARIPDPVMMAAVRQSYDQRLMRNLLKDVDGETSGYFGEGVEACIRGPLEQDVFRLHDAIDGAGTKEDVLNDVLLGRSNADLNIIKQKYQSNYKQSLEAAVRNDLSAKTERLFEMVLAARRNEESSPIIPHELERDVSELHRATEGTKFGADQVTVCQIFSSRSDGQLRAISQEYEKKYRKPLAKIIESEFSGHMEDALLRMLFVAEDKAMADAQALEDTMKGPGTKDRLLVNRIVKIHWDRHHSSQVKAAYRHRFKKDLTARIKGETSGNYEKLMIALIA